MAETCNHTWIPECGYQDEDKTRKLFLDKCDMYEYNCDYKKCELDNNKYN